MGRDHWDGPRHPGPAEHQPEEASADREPGRSPDADKGRQAVEAEVAPEGREPSAPGDGCAWRQDEQHPLRSQLMRVLIFVLVFLLPGGLGIIAGWLARRAGRSRRLPVYPRRRRPLVEGPPPARVNPSPLATRSLPDETTPKLVLSPLDAVMFVEHLARQRAEIETAEVFEGKGGASGGAGASGEWSPAEEVREPVDAGTIEPTRVVEAAVAVEAVSEPDPVIQERVDEPSPYEQCSEPSHDE